MFNLVCQQQLYQQRPLTLLQVSLQPLLLLPLSFATPYIYQQDWIFNISSYMFFARMYSISVHRCVCGQESAAERRNTEPASWAFCCLSAKPIICGKRSAASCHSFLLSPWQPLPRWTASWDSWPLLAVFHRAAIHSPVTGCMWLDSYAVSHKNVEANSSWVQWVLMGLV